MSIILVLLGILFLLLLIIVFKINAFISFIIVSLFLGVAEGMPPGKVVGSVQQGIGDTLGLLVLILGFGAMLGKIIADSGAAQKISSSLTSLFGIKNIQWALVITGFVVGIPMFYNVGFVVLIPLVFTIAASSGLSLMYVGIPMLASLSVTHGFLPPHPSPTAIVTMFGANMGTTMAYGILVSIPAIIIAGPLFARTIKNVNATPIKDFVNPKVLTNEEMPGIWSSLGVSLLPVLLIGAGSVAAIAFPPGNKIRIIVEFIGNPVVAMLISLLSAVYFLGVARGEKIVRIMDSLSHSVGSITMVLLIIAGSGGFKQVLVDSGVSEDIAGLLSKTSISPLLLAWTISALIRICIGSATVAGLTTAGILLPLATNGMVNKELLVLAIGAGSLMLSHVNDGGFWMFKEYFNLTVKETLRTWTVMEVLVSVTGLGGVMLLSIFV
jgi:Gnt-I system high-affinity gluconate transporter